MRREAARSAGPKLMPWMRGLAAAISSRFDTPRAVSRIAWIRTGPSIPALPPGGGGLEDRVGQDRPLDSGLGLELGEQAIDVVDVPGALDFRHHDHLEL